MGLKFLVILFSLSLFSIKSFAEAGFSCQYSFLSSKAKYESLLKQVQYRQINKLKIPYLDINPKAKKTVVLVPGFSKSMLTWVDQIELLSRQGYRVISMENFNIGLNLKKNGLIRLDANTGISADALTLAELVKRLKPKGEVQLSGHSRGAAVAAVASGLMLQEGLKINSLKLYSPYVEYIWDIYHVPGFNLSWFLDNYPGLIGQSIGMGVKDSVADDVIGLYDYEREKGYAYVLKGLQPYMGNSYRLSDSLNSLALESEVKIQIFGVQNDNELSPAAKIQELESEKIEVTVFEDHTMTHYWPLEEPSLLNSIIID